MAQITMARQLHFGARILFALSLLLAPTSAAPAKNPLPGAAIFDAANIVRINITIPDAGMRALRGSHWGGSPDRPKPEVKATVSDGTRTYKDVAVNLKGAAGSFRPIDDRPGLTLKFDKYVKGQTFHGLEK